QVPPSVSIAAGNSANSFTITTSPVSIPTGASINASAGGVTKSTFINVGPDPNAALALTSVMLSVAGVTGGNSVNGTVFLNANALAGGASVTLATSNLSAARGPPIVLVPPRPGFSSQTVTASQATISGLPAQRLFWRVRAINSSGVAGPFSAVRRFTAQAAPPPPPAASLSAVSVASTSVVGGNSSQGSVTLTSAAPTGGAVVSLSSANPTVAAVPASVTVAAGTTSAT